jgi:hypothetical protein
MGQSYFHYMLRIWIKPLLITIPHLLIVVFYLFVSVSYAIKGNVKLFRLIPQVVAMMPHPSKPPAPSSNLGVDIEFRSP